VTAAIAPGHDDPRHQRLELAAAIVLGMAALVAAWTAYQAALTDGDAAQGYAESNAKLSDANFFYARGNQQSAQDNQLWLTLLEAEQEGNTELAEFIETGVMSENLQEAVALWREPNESVTPFDDIEGNPYRVEDFETADGLQQESEDAFATGSEADEKGDTYELAGVLLAVALFIAGIATLFKRSVLSWALLAFAAAALVGGSALAFTA
jgi:Tfp pilus assembly protein PilE